MVIMAAVIMVRVQQLPQQAVVMACAFAAAVAPASG